MIVFTEVDRSCNADEVAQRLALTAEERMRSRLLIENAGVALRLPRGTVLREDDVLRAPDGEAARVIAKAEPVFRVTAEQPADLLRAAYHLGNRHVPVEVHVDHLIFGRDPVLGGMLEHLGLRVEACELPFFPERGAYEAHADDGHQH